MTTIHIPDICERDVDLLRHVMVGLTFVFAFHNREEIGPKVLVRIARNTGLKPEDL